MLQTVQRYFCWLDLRTSTHWLDQWGDVLYAQILESCWAFLKTQLVDYPTITIYQFVGDGLILEWRAGQDTEKMQALLNKFRAFLKNEKSAPKYDLSQLQFRAVLGEGQVQRAEHGTFHLYYGRCLHQLARILAHQSTIPNSNLWVVAAMLPFLKIAEAQELLPIPGYSWIFEILSPIIK